MKLANVGSRLCVIRDDGAVDLERLTDGAIPADPQAALNNWDELAQWCTGHEAEIAAADAVAYRPEDLGPPAPAPRQIFGIGLNYRDHAAEANLDLPVGHPVVFAKFPASVAGPCAEVELPSDAVDWEAELVVVIGRRAHRVDKAQAWDHVAGITVGQDLSDRVVQWRGPSPQFSLGKSYPGFAPIGPLLATPDEFPDPDNIGLGCTLNGERMQAGRSADMIFGIPEIIEQLSAVVPLLPGDLVFTGTPAGIGWTRNPRVVLRPGDRLTTHAEIVGEITTTFTAS